MAGGVSVEDGSGWVDFGDGMEERAAASEDLSGVAAAVRFGDWDGDDLAGVPLGVDLPGELSVSEWADSLVGEGFTGVVRGECLDGDEVGVALEGDDVEVAFVDVGLEGVDFEGVCCADFDAALALFVELVGEAAGFWTRQ